MWKKIVGRKANLNVIIAKKIGHLKKGLYKQKQSTSKYGRREKRR